LSPSYARHLAFARELIDGPGLEGATGHAFARGWYVAVTRKAHETADGALGRRLVSAGLRSFPEEPALLMAWGRLEETIAWHGPVWRVATGGSGLSEAETWGTRPPALTRTLQVKAALREAARLFERALRVETDSVEARLRLGRVQLEMGNLDQAEANLGQVLARHSTPESAYLAWIFLGRVRERRGNLSLAEEAYRSASTAMPGAQTAQIALSQALDRQGLSEEARATLRQSLTEPPEPDPFRTYVLAGRPSADEQLAALRQELTP
jgi:tetratricopeptide (TPR) repeat protein